MRINTIIDPEDEKKAIKILRKGKGAWKAHVKHSLNRLDESRGGHMYPMTQRDIDKTLKDAQTKDLEG